MPVVIVGLLCTMIYSFVGLGYYDYRQKNSI